eukprot:617233-Prymnesium_polylepis.1
MEPNLWLTLRQVRVAAGRASTCALCHLTSQMSFTAPACALSPAVQLGIHALYQRQSSNPTVSDSEPEGPALCRTSSLHRVDDSLEQLVTEVSQAQQSFVNEARAHFDDARKSPRLESTRLESTRLESTRLESAQED